MGLLSGLGRYITQSIKSHRQETDKGIAPLIIFDRNGGVDPSNIAFDSVERLYGLPANTRTNPLFSPSVPPEFLVPEVFAGELGLKEGREVYHFGRSAMLPGSERFYGTSDHRHGYIVRVKGCGARNRIKGWDDLTMNRFDTYDRPWGAQNLDIATYTLEMSGGVDPQRFELHGMKVSPTIMVAEAPENLLERINSAQRGDLEGQRYKPYTGTIGQEFTLLPSNMRLSTINDAFYNYNLQTSVQGGKLFHANPSLRDPQVFGGFLERLAHDLATIWTLPFRTADSRTGVYQSLYNPLLDAPLGKDIVVASDGCAYFTDLEQLGSKQINTRTMLEPLEMRQLTFDLYRFDSTMRGAADSWSLKNQTAPPDAKQLLLDYITTMMRTTGFVFRGNEIVYNGETVYTHEVSPLGSVDIMPTLR